MRGSTAELRVSHLTDPVVRQTHAHVRMGELRAQSVFTVFALSIQDHRETEAQCASLEEALIHLHELITSEMEDPDGPLFDRYGVYFHATP